MICKCVYGYLGSGTKLAANFGLEELRDFRVFSFSMIAADVYARKCPCVFIVNAGFIALQNQNKIDLVMDFPIR